MKLNVEEGEERECKVPLQATEEKSRVILDDIILEFTPNENRETQCRVVSRSDDRELNVFSMKYIPVVSDPGIQFDFAFPTTALPDSDVNHLPRMAHTKPVPPLPIEITLYNGIEGGFIEVTVVKRRIDSIAKTPNGKWLGGEMEILEPRYREITDKNELFPFTVIEFNTEGKLTQRTLRVPKAAFLGGKSEITFNDGLSIKVNPKGNRCAEVEYDLTTVAREIPGEKALFPSGMDSIVRFEVDIDKLIPGSLGDSITIRPETKPAIGRSVEVISENPRVLKLAETRESHDYPPGGNVTARPDTVNPLRPVVTNTGVLVPSHILESEANRGLPIAVPARSAAVTAPAVRTTEARNAPIPDFAAPGTKSPPSAASEAANSLRALRKIDETMMHVSQGIPAPSNEPPLPYPPISAIQDRPTESKPQPAATAIPTAEVYPVPATETLNGQPESDLVLPSTNPTTRVFEWIGHRSITLEKPENPNEENPNPGRRFTRGYSLKKIVDLFNVNSSPQMAAHYGYGSPSPYMQQPVNDYNSQAASSQVCQMISEQLAVALEKPAGPFSMTFIQARNALLFWGTEENHKVVREIIADLEKACDEIESAVEQPTPPADSGGSSNYGYSPDDSTRKTVYSPYSGVASTPKEAPWAAIRKTEELLAEKREVDEGGGEGTIKEFANVIAEFCGVYTELSPEVNETSEIKMVLLGEKVISGEHLLRRVLRPLGLTYYINPDGEIIICEPETADGQLLAKSYKIAKSGNEKAAEEFAAAIPSLLEPEFWEKNEKAAVAAMPDGKIWVVAPYRIHKAIEKLLTE